MIKMNEEFKELFSNLSEKDQKEVANLIRFKNEVKYHDKEFEELLQQYIELSREYDKLQNNWNELKKCTKETIEEFKKNRYILSVFDKGAFATTKVIYHKMQELEGNNE